MNVSVEVGRGELRQALSKGARQADFWAFGWRMVQFTKTGKVG